MLMLPRRRLLKLCLISLMVITTATISFLLNSHWMNIHHLLESLSNPHNYAVKSDRWIIIDAADASSHVTHVHVTGWRILVLGDSKRNKIRCSNCIHFSNSYLTKEQTYISTNHNTTNIKLQAVLYILNLGAEWIFWSNGISNLKEEVNQFKMARRQTGLIYRGRGIMNPARHFICQGEKTEEQTNLYELSSWSVPSIQKVWRPEALGKVSNKMTDYHAPPVLVPSLTFHTDYLRGSLLHRNLSWSLVSLFMTSQNHILSFWTQRLLWEFDGTTEFLPPLFNNADIVSKNIANRKDAKDKGDTLLALERKLSSWKCNVNHTFYTCVNELANMLAKWNYFAQNEVNTIKVWLSLLIPSLPKRNTFQSKRDTKNSTNRTKSSSGHRVVFNPRGAMSLDTFRNQTKNECSSIGNPFDSICKRADPRKSNPAEISSLMNTSLLMDDILLIIIFNNPGFLDNIKYLNYMYGRHFSHILVCGDSLNEFMKFVLTKNRVSFIEVNVKPGYYGYQCMMEAMKIGYEVQGYLQISDDVLLNIWNIVHLPRNQVWFQTRMRAGNLSTKHVADIDTGRYWWAWDPGRPTLKKVWKDFSRMLKDKKMAAKIQGFLNTLELNSGNNNSAFYEASDIYYIPAGLKDSYVLFSSWFLRHKVFHEIAIPTVINGLVSQKQVVRMSGSYLWRNENRRKYKEKYNSSHTFLHPFKLKANFKTKSDVMFICERYLPQIDIHLIRGVRTSPAMD